VFAVNKCFKDIANWPLVAKCTTVSLTEMLGLFLYTTAICKQKFSHSFNATVQCIAYLAGDASLVCNFASEDSSLPLNRDEFNSSSSSFIGQTGRDLGCFKCPVSCAKPCISASWYQKHQSKCPQPTRAIKGWRRCPFDCYQKQLPWMTLNGRIALYCTNDASFGAHHGYVKKDRPTPSAARM